MPDSIRITCPYCGERFEAIVDASGGGDYAEYRPRTAGPIELHLTTQGDDFAPDRS